LAGKLGLVGGSEIKLRSAGELGLRLIAPARTLLGGEVLIE